MPLSEQAAMLLSFDVAQEALIEHDDWHSHEHILERLSIPGFLRATRWRDCERDNGYFVMYEVRKLDVLSSPAYLERLNNPSPWTNRMMPHYRNMRRGFCQCVQAVGYGLGHGMQAIYFQPVPGRENELSDWLQQEILSVLPTKPGFAGFYFYRSEMETQMTREQSIRGKDQDVQQVLLASGYDMQALEKLANDALSVRKFEQKGAGQISSRRYQLEFLMSQPLA